MATQSRKKNALTLLTEDHEQVRKLFSELEDTTEDDMEERQTLLSELEREIEVHAKIEEEIFYPAFREAAEASEEIKMYHEAAEEHRIVHMLLPELKQVDPSSEVFAAKAKVLKDIVEHHADEEEQEMFKSAREIMSDDQLRELGTQLQERKDELVSQWDGSNGGTRKGRKASETRGMQEESGGDEEPAHVRQTKRTGGKHK